ncbi:MAG: hypothetical protein KJS92_08705, partial [Bacteroidetes bacterium]|nr:hypothetical protein [Bacteroidota bacterium]
MSLSGLWFICTIVSAQPGNRIQGNVHAASAKNFVCSGTQGYLFSVNDLAIGRGTRGQQIWSFPESSNYPYKPLGTAFLVAPDLLLSAGSLIDWHKSMELVWIPVQFLNRQVPDTSVFLVSSVKASAFTGVRGGDENFMLLQLQRKTELPSFALNFAPIIPSRDLRCCMDNGTLQPLSIEADEGIRSLFVAEKFP